jgi:hypothetical protein
MKRGVGREARRGRRLERRRSGRAPHTVEDAHRDLRLGDRSDHPHRASALASKCFDSEYAAQLVSPRQSPRASRSSRGVRALHRCLPRGLGDPILQRSPAPPGPIRALCLAGATYSASLSNKTPRVAALPPCIRSRRSMNCRSWASDSANSESMRLPSPASAAYSRRR